MSGASATGGRGLIGAGGHVRLLFAGDRQDDELTLKIRALVSKLGAQTGFAPLTVLVNGQVVADRLRIPGGGDLPQTMTFSVPGFCLVGEANILEIRSGADARSMLWLYQVFLESVWDRDAAENAFRAEETREPALTYETRLGEDGGEWRPGPTVRMGIVQGGLPVLPSDLSWRGRAGEEGSACFTAERNVFLGEFREADGTLSQWRGALVDRRAAFDEPGQRFTVEVNWGNAWHDAGELSVFVRIGNAQTARVGWREATGRSAVVVLADDARTFVGHAQNPNEGALGYRGRAVVVEESDAPAEYAWVAASGGAVPEGAVSHGRDAEGKPVWVARARLGGGVHPGLVSPRRGGAVIAYGGGEELTDSYEVLLDAGVWVRHHDGAVPDEAYPVGAEGGGEVLYAARARVTDQATGARVLLPGKIRPGFGGANIAVGGDERVASVYEVLVRPGARADGPVVRDRLRRGESIGGDDVLTSPDGRTVLSHHPDGITWLHVDGHRMLITMGGVSNVPTRLGLDEAGTPRLLGPDGRSWSWFYGQDFYQKFGTEFILRDGRLVELVDADGARVWSCQFGDPTPWRMAPEALEQVRKDGAWLESTEVDWFAIMLVRGLEPQAALEALGAGELTRMTIAEAYDRADETTRLVLAIGFGGWTMLFEPLGMMWDSVEQLEEGGFEVAAAAEGPNAEAEFVYSRDGAQVFATDDPDTDLPAVEPPAGEPLRGFIQRLLEAGRWADVKSRVAYPPNVEIACLLAEISPQPDDLAGTHPAGQLPRRV
ncbi:hypothetical protein GCM10022223_48520 [Kineosporia mesophila]|uniref:OAA-family lectin sugar binding domain-containing protein n=1 Tax=Kineosporia mesophila TaxID=566012 RepID=A0ABP7A622_9ACTN|nr:DM9 repeat-containing protein [Kineosporia mesophila]